MDLFVTFALVVVVAALIGTFHPRGIVAWAREEWRALWVEDFAPGQSVEVGTMKDPRVANRVVAQRALGRRMRREGRSLLGPNGKEYSPALTKAQPAPVPPKGAKVYPMVRRTTNR